MDDIPDDITPILREIDDSLKANGIPPHARSVHAIRAFGMRYQIKMPLFSLPPNAPADMVRGGGYAMQIHSWYEVVYGNRMKIDPSANAKIAHSDASGRSFRQHPVSHSGVSGHLRIVAA